MQKFLRVMVILGMFSTLGSASLKSNLNKLDTIDITLIEKGKGKKSVKGTTNKVISDAKKYLGVRYRLGGTTKRGIDCSAFVQKVHKKNGKKLPRTARQQFKAKSIKVSKKNAQKGDLIFFSDSRRRIGHVGIIIDPKKKLMIHASSGARKVVITSYDKRYYRNHYKGIRRI